MGDSQGQQTRLPFVAETVEQSQPGATPAEAQTQPAAESEALLLADVGVDVPGRDSYSYLVPDALADQVQAGDAVQVPFGPRRLPGFVIAVSKRVPPEGVRLRAILSHRTDLRLPPHLLQLIKWGAGYYQASLGEFLAAAVPAPVRKGTRSRPERWLHKQPDFAGKLTKRQAEVMASLPDEAILQSEAIKRAGCTADTLKRLVQAGALSLQEERRIDEVRMQVKDERHPMTDEQQQVFDAVSQSIDAREHVVYCLYGVTGSGKTLVYQELAQRVIDRGQQALILLPEIGLTPQLAARFRTRFERVVILHSAFSDGERSEAWRRIEAGSVDLVIGTRSALFAPLPDIGVIVVDEEHDGSYKQDSVPRYQARDMAVVYGGQLSVPVVLGSATPSLETYKNASHGRYQVLTMRQRPSGGQLPTPVVVDMVEESKRQRKRAVLSEELLTALRPLRAAGEQAIVLLNRRGWSPVVSCLSCGEAVGCPNCAIGLTYHRGMDQLRCHYCGYFQGMPQHCPSCGQPDLSTKGMGTEQLAHLLHQAIPDMRLLRIDADTVSTKQAHAQLLKTFADGEADCLVGTQMVAKGLDFPRVTVVGIVAADQGLHIPDFRAGERTYQLIAQVSGRAGRGDKPGRVIVQTYDTEAMAITCALEHKAKSFYTHELAIREEYAYPPGNGLARVLWRGEEIGKVQKLAEEHGDRLQEIAEGAVILGPVPAGIPFLKGQHRMHALIKGGSRGSIQAYMKRLQAAGGLPERYGVRCQIDVDPYSIL